MKLSTRFMRFVGGKDLIYAIFLLLLIAITIFAFSKVSFIFNPVKVILSTVLPPAILAFVLYYLLNPIVNVLEKWRIKRIWGIIILILAIGGLLTGLIFIVAPIVETQITDLIKNFPKYLNQMGASIQTWMQASIFSEYYEQGYQSVTNYVSELPSTIGKSLEDAYTGVQNVISTVKNVVIVIVTAPIVLFFLLKDGERFRRYCLTLLPPKNRPDADRILKNMDEQVGSYIQGQIIVASVIGILLFIGYKIIGLEYAIILALTAAVTSVVPYLGPTIAITPAIIIAIVHSPFMLIKLAIVWVAVQFLEGNFVSPNIMGKTMKIHPLTIVFVLLVGGNLFGLFGVILGIPGYAILKVLGQFMYGKFKARYNRFFGDDFGAFESDQE